MKRIVEIIAGRQAFLPLMLLFGIFRLGAQSTPVPEGFVFIKGGTFMMGSPASEAKRDDDEVQHRVTLSSFYLGKYEVTQKEWYTLMGTTPGEQRDKARESFAPYKVFLQLAGEGDAYPMYYVSWLEAVEYCNKRSQREGLKPVYTIKGETVTWNPQANGYRLPTEAEWEYACRAGTTTPYYTGGSPAVAAGWYEDNSEDDTHPVGQKQPNVWGLYDMNGNVSEWCWDWYGDYVTASQTDPTGASSGSYRVGRGGGFIDSDEVLRSAFRGGGEPKTRDISIGFRLVRSAN